MSPEICLDAGDAQPATLSATRDSIGDAITGEFGVLGAANRPFDLPEIGAQFTFRTSTGVTRTTVIQSVAELVGGVAAQRQHVLGDPENTGNYFADVPGIGAAEVATDVYDVFNPSDVERQLYEPVVPIYNGARHGDAVGTVFSWTGTLGGSAEERSSTIEIDGYETITVPFGTIQNAMRMREQVRVDGDLIGDGFIWLNSNSLIVRVQDVGSPITIDLVAIEGDPGGSGGGSQSDLTPVNAALKLPRGSAVLLPGQTIKFSGQAQNVGTDALPAGAVTHEVILRNTTTDETRSVATLVRSKQLKVGKSDALKATIVLPQDLEAASYEVLLRLDTGGVLVETSEDNNQIAAGTITVEEPRVDLDAETGAASARLIAGRNGAAAVGDKVSVKLSVLNQGNVPSSGTVSLQVTAQPVGGGDTVVVLGPSTPKPLVLKPGKAKSVTIAGTIPASLAGDQWEFSITVPFTPTGGAPADTNASNDELTLGTLTIAAIPV